MHNLRSHADKWSELTNSLTSTPLDRASNVCSCHSQLWWYTYTASLNTSQIRDRTVRLQMDLDVTGLATPPHMLINLTKGWWWIVSLLSRWNMKYTLY